MQYSLGKTCGHEVPANETTSESIKELCHGVGKGVSVSAVLVYQGYNDGIRDVHHYMGGLLVMMTRTFSCTPNTIADKLQTHRACLHW